MIKLTGINKIYRTNEIETVALENVNLEVNKGEFLSIMGPSGCGKSTLLNIMGLLDAPTGGTIEIAGTQVDGMKDKELAAFRNRKLGFVFQSFHLINSLNVLGQRGAAFAVQKGIVQRTSPPGRGSVAESRPEPPYAPHAYTALRRSVPACCHRTRHYRQSGDNPRR